MNELRFLLLIVALAFPTLVAFFVVVDLLFGSVTERCRSYLETALARTAVTGFINLLFFGTMALLSLALNDTTGFAVLALPGFLILFLLTLLALAGLTGVVSAIGRRILPGNSPPRATAVGAAVVTLASLAPIVGWFLLFPFLLTASVGAAVLTVISVLQRRRSDTPTA